MSSILLEAGYILMASIICWFNFVTVDTIFGLPKAPGVQGADVIGKKIQSIGGNLNGGYFMGNIVCSPDASAGTLMASIFYYTMGVEGGLIAIFLIYIGNRLCHDTGYAGTIGATTMTFILYLLSGLTGLVEPQYFIAGMVVAIFTIQGLSHEKASKVLYSVGKTLKVL
ncbi:energy-converting hydrogenase A subunit B [Methanococcus voltae]|uniref:hypothetical protein n=1 Tax=Methanococcus voltae TaxID=2188 RepID=UPI001AE5144A|nr:hypothetical protein [Methanococcus voltae]MBP2143768.1 energy-converting hydrogenase A subunit B [Methanococcus voltae]